MALWIGLEIYLTKVGEQVAHFVERIWAMGETGGKEESERGEEGGTNKQAARERKRERGRADGRMMNWINMCPQIGVLAVKTAWSSVSTKKRRDMSALILITMLHLEFKQAFRILTHSLLLYEWVSMSYFTPKLEEKKKIKPILRPWQLDCDFYNI